MRLSKIQNTFHTPCPKEYGSVYYLTVIIDEKLICVLFEVGSGGINEGDSRSSRDFLS